MAIYRQIHITFWQDPFILELSPEEKYFYLYLMTNSKTSQCGIYELPKKVMQLETGYNDETVDKLLKRFIDYGKILYDQETKEIMILNWLKHNMNTSPKVKSRIKKELKDVKNKEFLSLFHTVCKQYLYSIDTQTQPEPEPEPVPKPENNKKDIDAFFESVWTLYPERKGKAKVKESAKKNLYSHGYDVIAECIKRYKDYVDYKRADGFKDLKFQNGSTFFNSGYIDYLDENYEKPGVNGPGIRDGRKPV